MKNILVIQTAFLGDLILTLPLIQSLKKHMPEYSVDIVVIPSTSEILKNNPHISKVTVYDKRNSGIGELYKLSRQLKKSKYDVLISPHRSARSAMLNYLASPKTSIGFDKSSIGFLYDHTVKYETGLHEIQRNLRLLEPLGIHEADIFRPEMFIGESEKSFVGGVMTEMRLSEDEKFVAIAPGSVWFTKRFPENKFAELCKLLALDGIRTVLIGGKSDIDTGMRIMKEAKSKMVNDFTGRLTILQSAELIRRSSLLVTNDSAPLHIGNAVETPVFAVFGSTITGFGFYPYGKSDIVFETNDLACRPCGIHGRTSCPIGTLECMNRIDEKIIAEKITELVGKA